MCIGFLQNQSLAHASVIRRLRLCQALSKNGRFFCSPPEPGLHPEICPGDFALLACARVSRKRIGSLQVLDNRAEIDGFGIKRFVFGDLRSVQNLKAVAFEHFFAAAALEGNYLTADAFFAGTIEVAQISTHERARGRNFSRLRQEIDVKMRYAPW